MGTCRRASFSLFKIGGVKFNVAVTVPALASDETSLSGGFPVHGIDVMCAICNCRLPAKFTAATTNGWLYNVRKIIEFCRPSK
jgi:hypothetical protein